MKARPSLMIRAGIAKALGLVVGLVAFLLMPVIWPDASLWLRFGVWMWYATFGALIGILGVLEYHPIFKMRMPFWFRGAVVGGWLNLVVAFLMHDRLTQLMKTELFGVAIELSPFSLVLEGMIIGLAIDFVATRYGGEGKALLDDWSAREVRTR